MQFISPIKNAVLKRYPEGNINQGFGENPVLYSRFGMKGHNGVDIATKPNDSILCVADGEVIEARMSDNNGNIVSVRHYSEDGGKTCLETRYAHLSQIKVSVGQKVFQGATLGLEGNTGFVVSDASSYWGNAPTNQGVHLHFGVHPLVRDASYTGADQPHFISPFPLNGYNGAVDPAPYFQANPVVIVPLPVPPADPVLVQEVGIISKIIAILTDWVKLVLNK